MDSHPALISETAFECPHCGAFTTQNWYKLFADQLSEENRKPFLPDLQYRKNVLMSDKIDDQYRETLLDTIDKQQSEQIFIENKNGYGHGDWVINVHLSKCYNCGKISIWVHDKLIYPNNKIDIKPNSDLPDDIKKDFEEARESLNVSPRGSAALLRLCIQKLCVFLGEKGKNIDDDIRELVQKGLNPIIQKSLDIVRVIGNEAVHPGEMNISDDRDISMRLFVLVNSIAEQMISHPKIVNELYGKLPEEKRKAIELKDKRSR